MKRFVLFLAVVALLSGCGAPGRTARLEVATDLLKTCPVTVAPEDVVVKQLGVAGPAEYEYLGNVLVYDPGNAKLVPADTAYYLAKKAVSEAGGNYLYIMRLEASGGLVRSNYEIAGKILRATDMSPLTSASPLYEPMKEPKKQYTYMKSRDRSEFGGNSFYAGFGYGRILNPIDIPDNIELKYGSMRDGYQWEIGYEYLLHGTPWGFGANFSTFDTRYFVSEEYASGKFQEGTVDIKLHQVGPTASWNKMVMKNWHLSMRLGVGYGWELKTFIPDSVDNPYGIYDSLYGICEKFDAEFSYRFSKVISAGLKLGEMFYYVWGYDPDTARSYSSDFMILTAGPLLRITC